MLCGKPITLATGRRVACGKCMNCMVNHRRSWTARLLLEGKGCEGPEAGEVSWVTLTYADENLPSASRGSGNSVPTLNSRDYQLGFKLLRKNLERRFRFALVGEYGKETGRPHYHALIYGPRVLDVERALQKTWEPRFGHSRTRPWGMHDPEFTGRERDARVFRAQYCARYITKKMSTCDSPKLLPEQAAEFWRTSRNPGIGCGRAILDLHTSYGGAHLIDEQGDVARTVRLCGRVWPLGRTVREWLREQLGIPADRAERERRLGKPIELPEPTENEYWEAAQACEKLERRFSRPTESEVL